MHLHSFLLESLIYYQLMAKHSMFHNVGFRYVFSRGVGVFCMLTMQNKKYYALQKQKESVMFFRTQT